LLQKFLDNHFHFIYFIDSHFTIKIEEKSRISTIGMQPSSKTKSLTVYPGRLFHRIKSTLLEFFVSLSKLWSGWSNKILSFPIKRKLSIILVLVVIFVVTVLSIIFQQSQKRLLQTKLKDICNLSVRFLSYDIKDRLLLKRYDEIAERLLLIKQQKIEGMDYAWVINKEGQYIAHTDINYTAGGAQFIDQALNSYLLTLNDVGYRETETHYEFYYPLFFKNIEKEKERILIGTAGIGFRKDVILTPIRDAQKIIITIALLVTLFSFLGIQFLAQQMVKQIQELSWGAKQIGEGNLDFKISIKSRDELGQLAQEFYNMTMHLKEKLQMQKFVSQMTRQMIKKNIIYNNKTTVGEQRDVAVLFSDVRNFSAFSQRHEPQFVIELINIYLQLQAQIIEKYLGIVDKFMGDQIMGIFEGYDRNEKMLRAAITIQKDIQHLNTIRRQKNEEILDVGIGLNTGLAVVGHIGSKERLDYTVVGDVVNLASRFCDIAKPGQIITSVEFLNKMARPYPVNKLGSIFIKGRTQAVEICEIDYATDIVL
jgi:class 3 adenylate cyclase